MRRTIVIVGALVLAAASVAVPLMTGAFVGGAADPAEAATGRTPTRMLDPDPNPAATQDTVTVCLSVHEVVNNGMQVFGSQLDDANVKSASGDTTGAQDSVHQAGATLGSIANQLHAEAANAAEPSLQQAINDLAAEFARLGGQLTDLTALQQFDTTRLKQLADAVAEACNSPSNPTPGPSDLPGPSGGPGPSGEPPSPFRTGPPASTFTA